MDYARCYMFDGLYVVRFVQMSHKLQLVLCSVSPTLMSSDLI